jgi:FKBP-type peptidyl-prolyl cis-trans isomerase FkpA
MRLHPALLPAILTGVLIPCAPAQAPKPVTKATSRPAASARPRPAGSSGARPAVRAAVKTTAVKTATVKPAPPKEMTDEQKTIYALGLSISRSLKEFALSPAELDIVKQAITDADAGKAAVDIDVWGPRIQGLATARAVIVGQREKEAGAAYTAKAAQEPGAIKTASGLVYKELTPGTGPSPAASDTVKVHYRGTLIDGTEFDSSYKRNEPAEFPLNGVIRGWTEGVQLMKVGGKARLICPSDLAYGDQGRPSIPGGATLIFEIELLAINGK